MSTRTYTATTPGACACCGVGSVTMECRTRGGTATICGYPEWTSPSVPPKAYRTLNQGGSYTADQYTDAACSVAAPEPPVVCTWSGSCTYNVADCTLTEGGTQNCGGPSITNCGELGGDFTVGSPALSVSQTLKQAQTTGLCLVNSPPVPVRYHKYSAATQYAQLTDEDTETDAINRLLAGGGGTWSAWTTVGDGTGGTCIPSSCCLAQYQQRSGFSFTYREAQFRVNITGLLPLTNYVITVEIFRSLFGANVYSHLLTSAFGVTTDGSGSATITDDVPNLEGYDTYAANAVAHIPS